nr:anaphase-promoting complex subunit 4 isoform X1 [Ciona intestinalis]|eukprot:XP_018667524.1 anaphase-promoting complex subunit 4 isoform X1 [Ciona intestinalis]
MLIQVSAKEKSLPVKITDLCLTPNFKEVIFTISLENKPTSASCIAQVVKIPSKYHDITMWDHAAQTACHLTTTLSYMSNVLECMNESCDTVIQEMETKLTCYLINKPISGTIGDELLHFLLWGKSSDVIRDFLMKCITEKGVVKLKKFVESSYTYMLQLLLINFQMAADAIYYHVVEIKGMEKPAVIGGINLFDFNLVQEALESAGSFILKARELQHVVERSQKNFLAFFRFLHYSWLKVQDEPVDESSQMSSQELEFVADFITDSLIHEHEQLKASGKEKHFNFDKVYQYFQDAPLTSCLETEKNSWHHLVESTSTLSDNPLIIKQRPNASFRQLFLELRKKLQTLLNFPSLTLNEKNIQQKVEISSCLKPFPQQSCIWHKQAKTDVSTYILSTLSKPPHQKISFVKINPGRCRQIHLQFSESLPQLAKTDSHYTISDFAFYDEKFVTFLLATDSRCSILAQISFLDLISEVDERECDPDGGSTASMEYVDVSKYVAHYSTIEGMHAIKVASSGTRKVACLLGSDLRVIRTYEMEPSNDDYPDTDVSMNTG